MDSEIELHIESEEILPKPRICLDEDGNPIEWRLIIEDDFPVQHNLDMNERLF